MGVVASVPPTESGATLITPIQAECALAVAEAGSFRQASIATGIGQPVLSAHVRRLEKLLGVRLFERGSGAATKLTPEGVQMLPSLAAFVESETAIKRFVSAFVGHHPVPVRVGGHRLGIRHLLPRVLAAVREQVPDLVVEVAAADTSRVIEQLLRGSLDVGFGARATGDAAPDHIEEIELSRSPVVLFCPAGHELAGRDHVGFAELVGQAVIVVQSALSARLVDDIAAGLAVRPATSSAEDVDIALRMVAEGVGVAPLHRDVAVLADERVVVVPLQPELMVSVTLLRAADRPRSAEAEALWERLSER